MWMVAANFRRTQPKSVGLRVAFTRCSLLLLLELCTIGYTTREAAWSVDCGVGPRNSVLDGVQISHGKGQFLRYVAIDKRYKAQDFCMLGTIVSPTNNHWMTTVTPHVAISMRCLNVCISLCMKNHYFTCGTSIFKATSFLHMPEKCMHPCYPVGVIMYLDGSSFQHQVPDLASYVSPG